MIDELPIKTDDFTLDELSRAIKSLKNNKVAGLDEIPAAEVRKIGCLDDQLLTVCNKTYNGDVPQHMVERRNSSISPKRRSELHQKLQRYKPDCSGS